MKRIHHSLLLVLFFEKLKFMNPDRDASRQPRASWTSHLTHVMANEYWTFSRDYCPVDDRCSWGSLLRTCLVSTRLANGICPISQNCIITIILLWFNANSILDSNPDRVLQDLNLLKTYYWMYSIEAIFFKISLLL